MSTTRTRTLVLLALLAIALALPACTRSASTPPAEEGAATSPLDSQQATMEAVRAALLTQTAQAQPLPTEIPTQVVAPEETEVPETEVAETATPVVEYIEYTVKEGDWLFMIAETFGVDPQAIVDLNGLSTDAEIQPGLVLRIPPSSGQVATPTARTPVSTPVPSGGGRIHVVKPGEWVWQIARIYGVDPQAIIDANNLSDPGLIFPGMELVIP